ncbi:OmpP1/FadL family transporter [Hymenobacter tenuis]
MKNLKFYLAAALLSPAGYSFAQTSADALRFSQIQPGGTARTLGLGGANSAVGADLGNLLTNPAGLGLFQKSEISISPALGNSNTTTQAFGSGGTDARSSLLLSNLGVSFTARRPDDDTSTPWRGGTFAIGITRINDFNQNLRYTATPELNQDILQRFSEGQGAIIDELAYTALLTERDADGTYLPADYQNTGRLVQSETIQRSGGQTQFDFGYGTSYRDKIYLGGAIGIVNTRYNSTSVLTATDPAAPSNDPGTAFGSLNLREEIQTRGTGINARIGVIYRATDAVRLGASIQTPTYSELVETYSSNLDVTYDSPITTSEGTFSSGTARYPNEDLGYALTSPFRATGGAAVVIGKFGFLSADAEYVNYGQAHLGYDENTSASAIPGDLGPANDAIDQQLGSAVNLRLGGELRLDVFRLRAGFARYGDPYQNSSRYDRSQTYYTAGAGLRQKSFFLDVAGVYTSAKQFYTPYQLASVQNTPVIDVKDNRFTTTITAGFLF